MLLLAAVLTLPGRAAEPVLTSPVSGDALHALEHGGDARVLTAVRGTDGRRLGVACGREGPAVSCAAYDEGQRLPGAVRVVLDGEGLRFEVGGLSMWAEVPQAHSSSRSLSRAFGPAVTGTGLVSTGGSLPQRIDPALLGEVDTLPRASLAAL